MPFSPETLNAFAMHGRMAACEIAAEREGCRGFVAIYPPSAEVAEWTIRRFEVDGGLLRDGFDIAGEEMLGLEVLHLGSREEVEAALDRWGVSAAAFVAPWRTAGPF